MYDITLASTALPLLFPLFQLDGTTPATGLTPTVVLSKNGAAFASPAGAVSEVGNGWYKVAPNATDTNTLGVLTLHATATGAATQDAQYLIVGYNPLDGVHLGLTSLPNAAAGAVGGLASGDAAGHAIVGGYATNQDPVSLLRNGFLSLAPTAGTLDEMFSVVRALAKGKKIERPSANAIDYYAHDDTTLLFTLTYAPSLAAPITITHS